MYWQVFWGQCLSITFSDQLCVANVELGYCMLLHILDIYTACITTPCIFATYLYACSFSSITHAHTGGGDEGNIYIYMYPGNKWKLNEIDHDLGPYRPHFYYSVELHLVCTHKVPIRHEYLLTTYECCPEVNP